MGAPNGPQTPKRSERPGTAGALLWNAQSRWGPDMAPKPPNVRSAPAEPVALLCIAMGASTWPPSLAQQFGDGRERVAAVAQPDDHPRQRLEQSLRCSWRSLGIVEIDDRARMCAAQDVANLTRRRDGTLTLRLHRPEHQPLAHLANHGERRRVDHAPRWPEMPRRRAREIGERGVGSRDLLAGRPRAAQPPAPVGPRMISHLVTPP